VFSSQLPQGTLDLLVSQVVDDGSLHRGYNTEEHRDQDVHVQGIAFFGSVIIEGG
jgi:hypothetical protein